jgi:hypothetical protein
MRTDLQRLFGRKATRQVSSLEDFTTEALAIAIRHDKEPLLRALRGVPEWKDASGVPSIDFSTEPQVTAETQNYLSHEGLMGGRLDLVVTMRSDDEIEETFWIEVKIDAPLTKRHDDRHQLDVYLDHRETRVPKPVVLTLAKTRTLVPYVTGISWSDLGEAVETTDDADPWWTDLVAFLRAENKVVAPPPSDWIDPDEVLPIFREVNRTIKRLWPDAPKNLQVVGVDGNVTSKLQERGDAQLTGGPLRWGLFAAASGLEWRIAVATGSDYHRVHVAVADVIEIARSEALPDTWVRSEDPEAVLSQRRPYDSDPSRRTEIKEWLTGALEELHAKAILKPYHRALRTKLGLE